MYITYFSRKTNPTSSTTARCSLTEYERDIVRYIAGYVPMKLFRKYEKKCSRKASMYVECLSRMKVRGREGSLATYATAWVEEVNRGGLFEVHDAAYSLFLMLERLIRDGGSFQSVPLILSKEELLKRVENNTEIQHQWTILSVDIDNAQDLLTEVCTVWLSVRCNALTRRWMESYKQSKKRTVNKSKQKLRQNEEKKAKEDDKSNGPSVGQERKGKEKMECERDFEGEEEDVVSEEDEMEGKDEEVDGEGSEEGKDLEGEEDDDKEYNDNYDEFFNSIFGDNTADAL